MGTRTSLSLKLLTLSFNTFFLQLSLKIISSAIYFLESGNYKNLKKAKPFVYVLIAFPYKDKPACHKAPLLEQRR